MRTNLFLIIKYWTAHKAQLISITFSAAFLAAVVLLAGLMERTELRRSYELYQYEYGKQSHTYCDLTDEAYAEMRAEASGEVFPFEAGYIPVSHAADCRELVTRMTKENLGRDECMPLLLSALGAEEQK